MKSGSFNERVGPSIMYHSYIRMECFGLLKCGIIRLGIQTQRKGAKTQRRKEKNPVTKERGNDPHLTLALSPPI